MKNNNIERILASAIWFNDNKENVHQPKNIKTGVVLCGFRHCDIFEQTGMLVKERKEMGIIEEIQGFLTNFNRFVDRKEAGEIAFKAGQTDELIEKLHSEDLW
jgi:hypothetical protein